MSARSARWRIAAVYVGWLSLTLSALITLPVALYAMLLLRDLRCTSEFHYTFAPLLATCGERSQASLLTGWTLTLLVALGALTSVVLAVLIAVSAIRERATDDPRARIEAWVYAGTVVLAIGWCSVIVTMNPTEQWGRNAWIFFASSAVTASLLVGVIMRAVLLGISRQKHG